MENTVSLTLTALTLATLAVCLCSAVYAYLLQLDTSLAFEGALHVSKSRPVVAGRADHDAHRTALQNDFISPCIMVTVPPVKPVCSKRTERIVLNNAFDDLMVWCRAQDLALEYQTLTFAN
jgi:hypothetical protein